MKTLGIKTTSLSLITCGIIAACGGGGAGVEQVKVTYSDKVALGTIANYTDANWLYQNYLGDYGLPTELKPSFLPAMQMLANGFVLQLKEGRDVKANIEQVHSMFLQYAASGQAASFFAQTQADVANQTTAITTKSVTPSENINFVEPAISDEDKIAITEGKERDKLALEEIKATALRYNLPYKIDQHEEQWFIYSPTMKGGGKGGAITPPPASSVKKTHSNVKGWGWRRGDVVWVNGAGSITGVPGHNALAWGDGATASFVDANTDVGVSQHQDVDKWANRYTEVRALTPKLNWDWGEYNCYFYYGGAYGCRPDSYQRASAWGYASQRLGTPYNWNFMNPRDTTKFYCSSIVWNAYNHAKFNVIAPWELGSYGMITPQMLKDSRVMTTFKTSLI
jgi:Permuted papain-like amidase enzyme, YaeF/YiiX, C92 family